jgi:hypothetical protein
LLGVSIGLSFNGMEYKMMIEKIKIKNGLNSFLEK